MARKITKDIVLRFLTDTKSLNKELKEAEGVLTSFSKRIDSTSNHLSSFSKKIDKISSSVSSVSFGVNESFNPALKKVEGTLTSFSKHIDSASRSTSSMNSKIKKTPNIFKAFRNSVNSAGKDILKLSDKIPIIGRLTEFIGDLSPKAKIAAIGVGVLALSIGGMVSAGSQAETQLTSMSVLLKRQGLTMNQTKDFYQEMINLAGETPLASNQVTEAAKRLLSVETPMNKVSGLIRTIGDVSAGSGKNFLELVDIMVKNKTSGIIQGEDINQLAESGIPILKEFSRMTGKTATEIRKMGSEGKLTYSMLEEAMRNMSSAGGIYDNMMKKQSLTIAGLWSTIRDDVGMTMLFMSGALAKEGDVTFISRFKDIMSDIAKFTGSFFRENQQKFQDLGAIIGNMLSMFWDTGKAIYSIFKPVISITLTILGIVASVGLTMLKWTSNGIVSFLRGVSYIFNSIWDVAMNIGKWFYNFSGLAASVNFFIDKIEDFVASIKLLMFFTNAYIKAVFVSWAESIENFINKHSALKAIIDVITGKDTGKAIQPAYAVSSAASAYEEERRNGVQKKSGEPKGANKLPISSETNSTKNIYNINNIQQTQFINSGKKEEENNFYNLTGQPAY